MILDRDHERAILYGLLGDAQRGLSGVLVLHGEPGMGKTALLEHAIEAAPSFQLIRIAGVESEQDFGFAALHRFLRPALDRLDELPQPQREGLSSAFGLANHAPADPFLIGLATLTLLADLAVEKELLCIVDDSQWLDPESLQAIAFAARRIGADRIVMLFGLRTSSELNPVLAGLSALEITGLPEPAALELLSTAVSGPLDSRVADQIVAETSGCPLALTELATELSAGQWLGADLLSEPIPIGWRLESHFRRQVDALSGDAQTFALIVAAEGSGDIALVRRAAAELGCEGGEPEAVRSRLLVAKPSVQFRHPLIRSAVYSGASSAERRSVHRSLANAVDRSTDPDRWAQHLAAITVGYDERLASDLEAGAVRARDRGGFAAEASLLAQAAVFSQRADLRSRRLLGASAAALNAGAPERSSALLDQARSNLTDPFLVAQSEQIDGRLQILLMQGSRSPALLLSAARQFLAIDVSQARRSLLESFDAFLMAQYFTQDTDGAEIAGTILATRPSESDEAGLEDLLLVGMARLYADGYVEAAPALRRAARVLRGGPVSMEDTIRWAVFGMRLADELWDDRTFIAWSERIESVSRKQGALFTLRVGLVAMATHQIRAGRFSIAEAYFAESLEIIRAAGGLLVDLFKPLNVDLLAWQGDELGTRSAARELIQMGEVANFAVAQFQAYHALAVLELGAGRYGDALEAALFLIEREAIGWKSLVLPIVVEAGFRSGNVEVARRAMDELATRASASGSPWALGLMERAQAQVGRDSEAEDLYQRAIAHLEQTLVVTDLALAHLSYGEWLRRQDRASDAGVELRHAHDAFVAMGARAFAERARNELEATGERIGHKSVHAQTDLTPQELKIAQLASTRVTNTEIAAQMFISTSTVDYHLRKVYKKLGIASRRQLGSSLPL